MPDTIDYATIHLWPDTWLGGGQCSEDVALRFARHWINAHVDCCAGLGKPLVLTEFGKKPAGAPRAAFYQKVVLLSHPASSMELMHRKMWPTCSQENPRSLHPTQKRGQVPLPNPIAASKCSSEEAAGGNDLAKEPVKAQQRHAWLHRCTPLPLAMP